MNVELTYQARIAQYLRIDTEQVSLYWKGRVALYTVLKAMGVGPGDEVILPAFTCVVVPNAILYLGATPIYVDINPTVLCCSAEQIEQVLTPKTKAILMTTIFMVIFTVIILVTITYPIMSYLILIGGSVVALILSIYSILYRKYKDEEEEG
jgi:selenocysteine lyase/cysteine desulfurase